MRYQLGFTNLHHKGGVARSNVQYHGMKNFLIARFKRELSFSNYSFDSEQGDEKKRISLYEMNKINRQLVVNTRAQYRKAVKLYLADMKSQIGKPFTLRAHQLLCRPETETKAPVLPASQIALFDYT